MKTASLIIAVLAFVVATVQAVALGTNAERMARGLPPRAPRKLYREASPTSPAKRAKPSGAPMCSTGPLECCPQVTTADNPVAKIILGLLHIVLGPDVVVGLSCVPVTVLGGAQNCRENVVCCENNESSLISIGCVPISL